MIDLATAPVSARLSTLDRFLPVWIGFAMVTGILLGRLVPDLDVAIDRVKVDTVSLPIAVGLLAMMFPVLAKVRYRSVGAEARGDRAVVLTLESTGWSGRSSCSAWPGCSCRTSPSCAQGS